MLDLRVYRVAFVPAVAALLIAAFSLVDPPGARTAKLAPLAFEADRAFGAGADPARNTLRELATTFPRRRPGSVGDQRLADRVARAFRSSGFARGPQVRRIGHTADTVDGRRELQVVTAVRQGLSGRSIVVIAHRDALAVPATAELSGTAVLLELARLFAGRDLSRTIVLASVSGGSGGFDGAREAARAAPGPVDAVFVLGDLASTRTTRPYVLPWANGAGPAPRGLERTTQTALRTELETDPGGARAPAQLVRRALPLTTGEQGPVNGEGLPAVLVSASSENRPAADAPVSRAQLDGFGRGVLRAISAVLEAPSDRPPFRGDDGIVTMNRLVPGWAVRLLVLCLLLPALIVAVDAFFRVRRRGLPMGRWLLWVGAWAVPVLAAWAWSVVLGLTGLVPALGAPTVGVVALDASLVIAMASTLLVFATGLWWAHRQTRRGGALREVGAGGAAAAAALVLSVVTGVAWLVDPYAALVLLPAAHVWLLVAAPESRLRGRSAWPVAALGLLAPLLVVVFYLLAWSAGPLDALQAAWQMVAGGALGIRPMLVLTTVFACGVTVCTVLLRRDRAASRLPPQRLRTRGPSGYAGPGSLGGTESALRR